MASTSWSPPAGDITILAKQVDIVEARETSRYETEEKFKQSGITISVSNPLVSAMETGQQMADAASNTSDGRMQALAGAAAAAKGYNTYKGLTDSAGSGPAAAADITINLSYGSSESESKSSSQSNTAAGSTIAAGNNLTIVATGAGQASNLTAQGANLSAGSNVRRIKIYHKRSRRPQWRCMENGRFGKRFRIETNTHRDFRCKP